MLSPRTAPRRHADGRLQREPPQRVEATRRAGVLAALPVALMLMFLAGQLVLLVEQRRLIASQLELQRALTERTLPLVDDVRDGRGRLLAQARRGDRLVRSAAPLVRELRAAQPGPTAQAVRELADATLAALAEQRRLGLVRDADRAAELAPELVRLQREALRVQQETLVVQQEALARLRSIDQRTGGALPATALRSRRPGT